MGERHFTTVGDDEICMMNAKQLSVRPPPGLGWAPRWTLDVTLGSVFGHVKHLDGCEHWVDGTEEEAKCIESVMSVVSAVFTPKSPKVPSAVAEDQMDPMDQSDQSDQMYSNPAEIDRILRIDQDVACRLLEEEIMERKKTDREEGGYYPIVRKGFGKDLFCDTLQNIAFRSGELVRVRWEDGSTSDHHVHIGEIIAPASYSSQYTAHVTMFDRDVELYQKKGILVKRLSSSSSAVLTPAYQLGVIWQEYVNGERRRLLALQTQINHGLASLIAQKKYREYSARMMQLEQNTMLFQHLLSSHHYQVESN